MADDPKVFVVRWEHVIVTVISTLLFLGVFYGTVTTRMTQHEEHLRQLDSGTVKHEQFDEMRTDIRERLQRIEDKIDKEGHSSALPDALWADPPKSKRH
jgi:hypothetical protein